MGPKTFRFVPARLLLAGLLMVIGFGALAPGAAAQDDDATPVATEVPGEGVATPDAGTDDDGGDGGDGGDVAALPDTGSGSGDGSTAIVLTASALLVATLGLAPIGVRRLVGRHEI